MRAALVVLLCVSAGMAGCAGGEDTLPQETTGGGPAATSGETLGSPSGGSAGPGSTPATSRPNSQVQVNTSGNFSGGAHQHDMWNGRSSVVILDRNLETGPGGACVGYLLDNGCQLGEFVVRFGPIDDDDPPAILFPGTGRLEVKVSVAQLLHPYQVVVFTPDPLDADPVFKVESASKTFAVEGINESMTDPPHFRESSWSFMIQATAGSAPHRASLFTGPVHWTVTVHRDPDRELPVDPPHPDYWEGQTQKTIYQQRQNLQNYFDTAISETVRSGPQLKDNRTVMIGTHKVVVTMSWSNSYPDVNKPGLVYCPAGGYCDVSFDAPNYKPAPKVDQATRRVYEVEVRPEWWDSPYEAESRWKLNWYFDGPGDTEFGVLNGYIDWTVEIFKQA